MGLQGYGELCRYITFYFPTARAGKMPGPVVQSIVRLTVLYIPTTVYYHFIIITIIIIIRMFVSHRSFLKSFFKS